MLLYYFGFFTYWIATKIYFLLLKVIAPFNSRAKLFVNGRKNLFNTISQSLGSNNKKSIWFHVASLGEFEQARPVIEELKKIYTEHIFIVTFFSPSGFEVRKNDKLVDHIFYLPNDSKNNAKKLIKLFNPSFVIWVKYDFWFFYLTALKANKIPVFLIDASFNNEHIYFKKAGLFYKKLLQSFTHIFTQNIESIELLKRISFSNATFAGDTRFDRVYNSLEKTQSLPIIEQFKAKNLLLVIGSSYLIEETFLANFLAENKNPNLKIIIAPHFIKESRIKEIENLFPEKTIRYSQASKQNILDSQILIVDNIGMLSSIYKYADISFIGGGFVKKGLHNILEAATFGNAILFGNKVDYFPEASLFEKEDATIVVENQSGFNNAMNLLIKDSAYRTKLGKNAQNLILKNIGSTKTIIEFIKKTYLHLK